MVPRNHPPHYAGDHYRNCVYHLNCLHDEGTNKQIKRNSLVGAGNNMVDVKLYKGAGEFYMDEGTTRSASPDKRAGRNPGSWITVEHATFYRESRGQILLLFYNGNISFKWRFKRGRSGLPGSLRIYTDRRAETLFERDYRAVSRR